MPSMTTDQWVLRVLICGDRNWDDQWIVDMIVSGIVQHAKSGNGLATVIEGAARGADTQGRVAAYGYDAVVEEFPAKWDEHGKAAGPIRNQQMLDQGRPDVVIAFHDNLAESKGTADMVRRAKRAGIPVYVIGRP